jgi:uncharacterized surface protein with fasciclin (FAS1) repeats|nr:fasciclin domain-containing protein [Natronomonas aquatica]
MREPKRRSVLKTLGSTGLLLAGGVGAASAAGRDGASDDRQLTVFAPTDEAFNAVGITEDNVGDLDDEFLSDVLTYHVTPGRRYAESVLDASQLPT